MDGQIFTDRLDAGRQLAEILKEYAGRDDVVVLALPRGGVPVAWEVAKELDAPLDVFVVRKLGAPGREELAIGAIASGNVQILNQRLIDALGVHAGDIEEIARREAEELQRREKEYRGEAPPHEVKAKVAIIVDDGLATGSTMRAAVSALEGMQPAKLVVAVPTSSPETCEEFRALVDEVHCVSTPVNFSAVGQWYKDFSQTSDEEVQAIMRQSRDRAGFS
jgi:predicted phosphoribosyltransferase